MWISCSQCGHSFYRGNKTGPFVPEYLILTQPAIICSKLTINIPRTTSLAPRHCSFKNTSSQETGLSYHHHLIYSVLKTTFECQEPKNLFTGTIQTFLKVFEKILWEVLGIYQKLQERVVVWFTNTAFHRKYSLQATSEKANRDWHGRLCWYNFNGFV